MLPDDARSAENARKELERRLRVAFDGADWALRHWVRRNFGPEVSHGLPGLLAPFDHLCHEAALKLDARGLTDAALAYLDQGKRRGTWRLEVLASLRYGPLGTLVVVAFVMFDLGFLNGLSLALWVFMVVELVRLGLRRQVAGFKVSAWGVFAQGVVAECLLEPSDKSPPSPPAVTQTAVHVRTEGSAASVAQDADAGPSEQPVSPMTTPDGPWPKYDPSWDEVPECMADAMWGQRGKGWRLVALDRVAQGERPRLEPISNIDLGRYFGRTVTITTCCSTCESGLVAVPMMLGKVATEDRPHIVGKEALEIAGWSVRALSEKRTRAASAEATIDSENADMHPMASNPYDGPAFRQFDVDPRHLNRFFSGETIYFAITTSAVP